MLRYIESNECELSPNSRISVRFCCFRFATFHLSKNLGYVIVLHIIKQVIKHLQWYLTLYLPRMPTFPEIPMLDRITFYRIKTNFYMTLLLYKCIHCIISVTKKSELLEKVHLVTRFFIDVKTMDWCVLSRYFMFFSLDRLVTKNQICTKYQISAKVFVVVTIWKENRTAWTLFKLKQQQKLQLTFVV